MGQRGRGRDNRIEGAAGARQVNRSARSSQLYVVPDPPDISGDFASVPVFTQPYQDDAVDTSPYAGASRALDAAGHDASLDPLAASLLGVPIANVSELAAQYSRKNYLLTHGGSAVARPSVSTKRVASDANPAAGAARAAYGSQRADAPAQPAPGGIVFPTFSSASLSGAVGVPPIAMKEPAPRRAAPTARTVDADAMAQKLAAEQAKRRPQATIRRAPDDEEELAPLTSDEVRSHSVTRQPTEVRVLEGGLSKSAQAKAQKAKTEQTASNPDAQGKPVKKSVKASKVAKAKPKPAKDTGASDGKKASSKGAAAADGVRSSGQAPAAQRAGVAGALLAVVSLPVRGVRALASRRRDSDGRRGRLDSTARAQLGVVVGGVGVMVALTVVMVYPPAQELYQAIHQREAHAAQLATLTARNDQLRARVRTLQTVEGIQDEARSKYNYILPGETLVNAVGDRNAYESPEETEGQQEERDWATELLESLFDTGQEQE